MKAKPRPRSERNRPYSHRRARGRGAARVGLAVLVVGAGVAPAVHPALATAGTSDAGTTRVERPVGAQLAAVRAATAKYHDVDTAIAEGYRPSEHCVSSPAGAMGFHYTHPQRLATLDPQRPAILMYLPSPEGLQLAGVEYFQPDADQNMATDGDRPVMFGHAFDGPMPGHEPGMPIHYDLHVWLWKDNPSGMFSAWNPAASC